MYLLDTDTLSALHKDNPHVIARVSQADAKVATTIITKLEILRGRIEFVRKAATGAEVLRAQQWLNRSEELLALLEIIPFDAAAGTLFDGLRTAPGLGKIGRADLLIASIALA
ncbi:MAG TPA: type II toxin-antitoxin system VapC family toxin [Blastocatellia bacterium]|nr:type II toxin-antitoxin system VapC family toxin [Blastocatellia bacterium]